MRGTWRRRKAMVGDWDSPGTKTAHKTWSANFEYGAKTWHAGSIDYLCTHANREYGNTQLDCKEKYFIVLALRTWQ